MTIDNTYHVSMKLIVRTRDIGDFGAYKCVAKNPLGETEKTVFIHRMFYRSSKKSSSCNLQVSQKLFSDKSKTSDTKTNLPASQIDNINLQNNGKFSFFFIQQKL